MGLDFDINRLPPYNTSQKEGAIGNGFIPAGDGGKLGSVM